MATTTITPAFIGDLTRLANRYPADPNSRHWMTLHDRENWVRRVAHDIGVATERIDTTGGGTICDVGGGYGLFSAGCAMLGMHSILIDDFCDLELYGILEPVQELLSAVGVEVRRRDVLNDGLALESGSLDAVASMHVLEHLPTSPKRAFTEMAAALKPGGVFLLAGPNAVNLRKRIAVPLGRQGWSPIQDWYDSEQFRGHVREPLASDFGYIARSLGLVNVGMRGANFMATVSVRRPVVRALAPIFDGLMRTRPSLCSELYMLADKPD